MISKKMTMWAQHLKQGSEEKAKFEEYIRNSSDLILRLRGILDKFEDEVYQAESSEPDYEKDSWGYLQAHRNGKKEILRVLQKLTQHLD